jgi:hypothetical protein
MRINSSLASQALAALLCSVCLVCAPAWAQRIQFPSGTDPSLSGLRPIAPSQLPKTGSPVMVPLNPATQAGIYPSTGFGSPTFDPYSLNTSTTPQFSSPSFNPTLPPPGSINPPYVGSPMGSPTSIPMGGYPSYNGVSPTLPGTGQSGTLGTFQNTGPGFTQPGIYPNSTPSALFPANSYNSGSAYPGSSGSLFGNMYNGVFGNSQGGYGGNFGQPVYPPNAWNTQGTMFGNNPSYPEFIRLFQGPRFRHAYIHGNDDFDALMINDSDLALAFAFPNFFHSGQPLYLLPSFSLHQWAGPRPPATADLPALAYSAFLDSGWQSDPAQILGAELGLRVGMFSDFETATSDSLRIQGRGIGRLRVTPRVTLKGGIVYLDRNRVKMLPAFGVLWQPNPDTRFDLFFPEPKLAHYLATIGTADTWWYVAGYYGGGNWTVKRTSGSNESIDINDIRLVLGWEWGRNDQMREGRRVGFFEVGYVFDRELLFKESPVDNLDLQDNFMVRAGIGF